MAGTPSEADIRTQWTNCIALLEKARDLADGTLFGASGVPGGDADTLIQSLEGQYTPGGLGGVISALRSSLSGALSPQMSRSVLHPILYEYARILGADASDGVGAGYTDPAALFRALRQWFTDNSVTVQSRNITTDTTATAGASNVGNGAVERIAVDDQNFPLEARHVEKKQLVCISDQNSGAVAAPHQ